MRCSIWSQHRQQLMRKCQHPFFVSAQFCCFLSWTPLIGLSDGFDLFMVLSLCFLTTFVPWWPSNCSSSSSLYVGKIFDKYDFTFQLMENKTSNLGCLILFLSHRQELQEEMAIINERVQMLGEFMGFKFKISILHSLFKHTFF